MSSPNPKDYLKTYEEAGKESAEYWWKHDALAYLRDFPEQHKRIDWIISMLYGSVLDVGCGCGLMDTFIVAQPYVDKQKIVGVDLSHDLLKWGQHWHTPAHFIRATAEHLPFPDESFDCVILAEILEHVLDPDITVKEAKRVLKNKGTLVVTTPLDEEKWLVNAPLPNPQHLRSFTIKELRNFLSKHGFKAYAVPSGTLGEPFEYSYHTPEGWKTKICQTRLTFIYAAGVKL